MMSISYSKLDTFRQCPLKYRYRYIDRRRERKSWPFSVLGTAIHDAIADFERMPSGATRTSEVLEDLMRHHWRKQDRRCFKSMEEEVSWGRKGLEILRHYFYAVVDRERPRLCEAKIDVRFPKFHLIGQIDQLHQMSDGRVMLIEMKSGNYVPSQEEVDRSLQCTLYALGVTRQFNIAPDQLTIVIWQLAAQRKLITTRSADQLEAAIERVDQLVDDIQKETDFEPTPNRFCTWCDYTDACSRRKHRTNVR